MIYMVHGTPPVGSAMDGFECEYNHIIAKARRLTSCKNKTYKVTLTKYVDDVLTLCVCVCACVCATYLWQRKLALSVQINKRGKNLLIECNVK